MLETFTIGSLLESLRVIGFKDSKQGKFKKGKPKPKGGNKMARKYYLYIGTEAYTTYAYDSGVPGTATRVVVCPGGWEEKGNPPEEMDLGSFKGTLIAGLGPFPSWEEAEKAAKEVLG